MTKGGQGWQREGMKGRVATSYALAVHAPVPRTRGRGACSTQPTRTIRRGGVHTGMARLTPPSSHPTGHTAGERAGGTFSPRGLDKRHLVKPGAPVDGQSGARYLDPRLHVREHSKLDKGTQQPALKHQTHAPQPRCRAQRVTAGRQRRRTRGGPATKGVHHVGRCALHRLRNTHSSHVPCRA
jgi:hypothetical protein